MTNKGDAEKVPDELNVLYENADVSDDFNVEGIVFDETEFAFKLINSVKALNCKEISHKDLVERFATTDELKCLFLFIQSLPYQPIKSIYPEKSFFLFKGVPTSKAYDLSHEAVELVQEYIKIRVNEHFDELRLYDLEQPYLASYERAMRVYNDLIEKSRKIYHETVKSTRLELFQIIAVICMFVIIAYSIAKSI